MSARKRFTRVAAKRLTGVEVDPSKSNQNEFGGGLFRELLGLDSFKKRHTRFTWIGNETSLTHEGWISWYDTRLNQEKRSPEWRAYYQRGNPVVGKARAGDLVLLLEPVSELIEFYVIEANSSVDSQIRWLLGLGEVESDVRTYEPAELTQRLLDHGLNDLLDDLRLEPDFETGWADKFMARYPNGMPPTKEFSLWARNHCDPGLSDEPDLAIDAWMAAEERLFRAVEAHELAERLITGFAPAGDPDVDGFLDFAKSILNRRKSRAGHALEHHIGHLLAHREISFDRGATTEGNKKPDFLFPGEAAYEHARSDPAMLDRLRLLGAKTSCKDRWRQVLSEAALIEHKHLLTLEAPISKSQTAEMADSSLTLVIPSQRHERFTPAQRSELMTVSEFFDEVQSLQE